MTRQQDDGPNRHLDRRALLRATALSGAAAFGLPAVAGVAAAGTIPDRLYWTGCSRVRGDGLARGESLAVVVAEGDGLSEVSVEAATRTDSEPPWGFEYALDGGYDAIVAVRTSGGQYVPNPAECAAPYAERLREAYGADAEIAPEVESVVDGGDTDEGPRGFERVARLERDDPGWRSTFGVATAVADDQVLVGFPDNTNPNGFRAGAVYVYERRDGEWSEVQRLLADAPGKTVRARFGDSLDVEGDRLVVGSAERLDEFDDDVGLLYVFERTDGEWTQTARLNPSEPMRYFSTSVAVAGDEAFFGAAFDEAEQFSVHPVSVFAYDGDDWTGTDPVVSDQPTEDLLYGLSIDFDGTRGVVGAPRHENAREEVPGRAYVYARDGDEWRQAARLLEPTAASAEFATRVATAGDSVFVADPGFRTSAVYRYAEDGGEWTLADTLTPADAAAERFGIGLAAADGTVLVGSSEGLHVFDSADGSWTETEALDTGGTGLSVSGSLAAAREGSEAVSVFER